MAFTIFFLANYYARAVTVLARQGETLRETIYAVSMVLFIPGSGAVRSLRALFTHASFSKDKELEGRLVRLRCVRSCMHGVLLPLTAP
jgi:hypothetical protein